LVPFILGVIVLLLPSGIEGAQEDTADVNIEKYIEFRIEFDHGDKLHLKATIDASPYPVSIFLMKGETAYKNWTDSEDVDVQAIKEGKNVSNMNVAFQVIENFSIQNTTSFNEEIDIGDRDTYYLIIALHKEASMSTEDVLARASAVEYSVEWQIKEKDVPYELLALAALFLIAGIGFLVAYFINRKRQMESMEEEEETPTPERRREPPVRDGRERRRAPPMR